MCNLEWVNIHHVPTGARQQRSEWLGFSETGGTGVCELPGVGIGNLKLGPLQDALVKNLKLSMDSEEIGSSKAHLFYPFCHTIQSPLMQMVNLWFSVWASWNSITKDHITHSNKQVWELDLFFPMEPRSQSLWYSVCVLQLSVVCTCIDLINTTHKQKLLQPNLHKRRECIQFLLGAIKTEGIVTTCIIEFEVACMCMWFFLLICQDSVTSALWNSGFTICHSLPICNATLSKQFFIINKISE